jgi:hypothetical protein
LFNLDVFIYLFTVVEMIEENSNVELDSLHQIAIRVLLKEVALMIVQILYIVRGPLSMGLNGS